MWSASCLLYLTGMGSLHWIQIAFFERKTQDLPVWKLMHQTIQWTIGFQAWFIHIGDPDMWWKLWLILAWEWDKQIAQQWTTLHSMANAYWQASESKTLSLDLRPKWKYAESKYLHISVKKWDCFPLKRLRTLVLLSLQVFRWFWY